MLCFFYGLSKVPLANATALSFSTTLFATMWAALFLKEVVRARRWLAIIVGLIGVLIVLQPNPSDFNSYSLLLVVAAMFWGASVTIVKRLTQTESAITIVTIMTISLTVLSLPTAIVNWTTPSFVHWPLLLAIGAIGRVTHNYWRCGDIRRRLVHHLSRVPLGC